MGPKYTVKTLKPLTSFGNNGENNRIPLHAALFLSPEYTAHLPVLKGKDLGLWPWFFTSQLEPVFSEVTRVQNVDEVNKDESIKVVVKPELWGFYAQMFNGQATVWIDIKYRVLDRNGKQLGNFMSEGFAQDKTLLNATAYCITEESGYFQKQITGPRKELVMSSVK